jgi:hypothetical protein
VKSWLRERRRRRELRAWFRVSYYRERHEVYLKILAIMRMVRDHRSPVPGAPFWDVSGMVIKAGLFLSPCTIEVDSAMVADMLRAMRTDGLIERVHLPPKGTPEHMSCLHARYYLTERGDALLDTWWVHETLARFRPLPSPEHYGDLFVRDV